MSINDGKISLEWTWQGNSLRWDSLVPDGMPITLRDGNMQENGSVSPCEEDCLTNVKARAAQIFKKVRDKAAYDPEYQRMRKEWRASE